MAVEVIKDKSAAFSGVCHLLYYSSLFWSLSLVVLQPFRCCSTPVFLECVTCSSTPGQQMALERLSLVNKGRPACGSVLQTGTDMALRGASRVTHGFSSMFVVFVFVFFVSEIGVKIEF